VVLDNQETVRLLVEGSAVALPAGAPGQRVRILLGANGAVSPLP
jgi:hypothetical protein